MLSRAKHPSDSEFHSEDGFLHRGPSAAEPQPKADPIGHKDRKKGLGFGRDRPRAYRRDAGYSIYLRFLVLFVAINSSRPASIFEDSNTETWVEVTEECRACPEFAVMSRPMPHGGRGTGGVLSAPHAGPKLETPAARTETPWPKTSRTKIPGKKARRTPSLFLENLVIHSSRPPRLFWRRMVMPAQHVDPPYSPN